MSEEAVINGLREDVVEMEKSIDRLKRLNRDRWIEYADLNYNMGQILVYEKIISKLKEYYT